MSVVSHSDRILITGGSGFTGRPLAQRLAKDGYTVTCVSRRASASGGLDVDLLDLERLAQILLQVRPSAIVHLGGISGPTHKSISEIYSANVIGTANLFAAIESARLEPRIIIVASSAHLYAVTANNAAIQEDSKLATRTHYTVSKHAVEEIAAIYARKFPILITRPFNYTGPGQTTEFLVPKIIQHYAERRSEIRLGNLDVFRDFSDVDRVVEAYARLVSRGIEPTTVNICSGRSVHLLQILDIMKDLSGHSVCVIPDPSLFRLDEPRFMIGSPSHLESLIGDLPNPDFSETLSRMYATFGQPANAGKQES